MRARMTSYCFRMVKFRSVQVLRRKRKWISTWESKDKRNVCSDYLWTLREGSNLQRSVLSRRNTISTTISSSKKYTKNRLSIAISRFLSLKLTRLPIQVQSSRGLLSIPQQLNPKGKMIVLLDSSKIIAKPQLIGLSSVECLTLTTTQM